MCESVNLSWKMLVQDGGCVSAYFCGEQKKIIFIHNPLTREVKPFRHIFLLRLLNSTFWHQ